MLAPAGERWYVTEATPEPVSPVVEVRPTVPERLAPGSSMTALGAVLSTRRSSIAGEAKLLRASSVTTMRRSKSPSTSAVVSQEAVYGAVVSAAPRCRVRARHRAAPRPRAHAKASGCR